MTLIDTVQLQEMESAFVSLFEITLANESSTTIYLAQGLEEGSQNLYFGSRPTIANPSGGAVLNEYVAIPIDISGSKFSASGPAERPTLTVANIVTLSRTISDDSADNDETESSNDADETTLTQSLASVDLSSNDDFLGATVVLRTTLLSHTKNASDADFDEYSATAPVEFPSQTFIVDRVSAENSLTVSFELASPFDIEGKTVPARQPAGRYCSWEYQGVAEGRPGGCTWYRDSDGRWFDEQDNVIERNSTSIFPTTFNEHSTTQSYSAGTKVYTVHRPSSSTHTFNPSSAVNATNDTITISDCNFRHGEDVIYSNGGGANIGGLTSGTTYILVNESDTAGLLTDDIIGLASNETNFNSETLINLTSQGSGTQHSLTLATGFVKIWECLVTHNSQGNLANSKSPIDTEGNTTNSRIWKRLDVCGKTINSCKVRFQGSRVDSTLDQSVPLPFGGFPGLLKFK